MDDFAWMIVGLGFVIAIAVTWFIVQAVFVGRVKKYLLADGWEIARLNFFFRTPKTKFLRAVDFCVRKGGGQNPLLMATKKIGDQMFVTEITTVSTPAPYTAMPIFSIIETISAGTYKIHVLITNRYEQVSGMEVGAAKKDLENDHAGTRIITRRVNFPTRWIRAHQAIVAVAQQRFERVVG